MVAFRHVVDLTTARHHHSRGLMPQQSWPRLLRIVQPVKLRVADTSCELLYDDVMRPRIRQLDLIDNDRLFEFNVDRG